MNTEPEKATEAVDGLCCQSEMEGAHASAMRRLTKEAPPFRPEASSEEHDGKLRLHAEQGLERYEASGLSA